MLAKAEGRGQDKQRALSRQSLRVGVFVGAEPRGLRRIWELKESRITALSGRRVLEIKSEEQSPRH